MLRYYCPDEVYWSGVYASPNDRQHHEEKLRLLEKIREVYGIDYELFVVRSTPEGIVDEDVERAIYREHMVPRASVLIPRLEEKSVSRAFRSQQGTGHYYVARCIAILEDGLVGWATGTESSRRRFLPAGSIDTYRPDELFFLESLLSQGPSLLSELCFRVEGTPEQRLVERFLKSGTLHGTFRQGVWLPLAYKQMDLICEGPSMMWVLEAKTKLNWEALGQVLGYAWYFARENPDTPVHRGIICGKSDRIIEELCSTPEFAVTVFVETADGFEQRGFIAEKR